MLIKKRRKPVAGPGGKELTPRDKLQHSATKEIGRELKKVKAFLLQKLVKRCRKLREGGGNGGNGGGKRKKKKEEAEGSDGEGDEGEDKEKEKGGEPAAAAAAAAAQEGDSPAVLACLEEIKAVKALTAESLAPICLRQLGLAYTGTEHAELNDKAKEPGPLKQALEHPRMAALLKTLDEKATDLRRNKGRKPFKKRQRPAGEGEDGGDGDEEGGGGGGSKLRRIHTQATSAYEGSSVFVDSLSGYVPRSLQRGGSQRGGGDDDDDGGGEDGEMDVYGYKEFGAPERRKNRMGQRQRKQKLEAIQAAMEGRARQGSNWRGDRAATGGNSGGRGRGRGGDRGGWGGGMRRDGGGRGAGGRGRGGGSGGMGGPPGRRQEQQAPPPPPAPPKQQEKKPDEKLHPSWAAKQAQRTKEAGVGAIGAFQGKKITFATEDD